MPETEKPVITSEADKLIYEKSNTYRLHADNLRWGLLGGYAAFYGAVITIINSNEAISSSGISIAIYLILFVISSFYILILATQNWYYQLFSTFVKECESRLAKGEVHLRTLDEFTREKRREITPNHPAFAFAIFIVWITGSISLLLAFSKLIGMFSTNIYLTYAILLLGIVFFLIFIYFIILIFKKWDSVIYQKFLRHFQ